MFTVRAIEFGKGMMNVHAEAGKTIISGTHRPQDLIPALMDVIRDTHYFQPLLDSVPSDAIRHTHGEWHVEQNHKWFDSEDCTWFVDDELWGALTLCCPAGHYFGTHGGDGSDFAFWPYEQQ